MKKNLLLMSAMLLAASSAFAQSPLIRRANIGKAHETQQAVSTSMDVMKVTASTERMAPETPVMASPSRTRAPRRSYANNLWYQRPEGSLYISGSNSSENAYWAYLYMPPFTTVTYNNMSANKNQSAWTLTNGQPGGESTPVDANADFDLELQLPKIEKNYISPWYIPTLTISGQSYRYGQDFPNSPDVYLINGDSISDLSQVNLSNGYYYGFSNGGSFGNREGNFGNGVVGVRNAIYEFYKKPLAPLCVSGIFFRAANYDGTELLADGATMNITICKVDEDGNIGEVIADMPFSMEDATYTDRQQVRPGEYVSFANFEVTQKEVDAFGTEYEVPFIINDEFVLILSGFDKEGVNMTVFMTGDIKDTPEDYYTEGGLVTPTLGSYVDKTTGEPIDGLYYCQYITKAQSDQYNKEDGDNYDWTRQYNAVFFLEAMHDVVSVYDDFKEMVADAEGGPVYAVVEETNEQTGETEYVAYGTVQYQTTLPRLSDWEGLEGEENYEIADLPDWLSIGEWIDDYYNQNKYWTTLVQLVAAPLPEGVKGRKAEIRIVSERGADSGIITITQGEVSDEPALTDGKYYLKNVAAGKFWGAGNGWGTQASLLDHAEYVTLAQQPDGTYQLESQVSNGGTSYYFNGDYMDGAPINLTITNVNGNIYTIANEAGELFGSDGSTVLGKNVAAGEAAQWQILTEDDLRQQLAAASETNPVDATFLILDPNFGRNNRNQGAWSMEASNKNLSGGNNTNNNAESYHSVFTLSQLLENVPNGVYSMTAQGFYRQDGADNDHLPYFYINDEKATFPLKTGAENSMSDASASFTNGLYTIAPIYVKVENGTITLGAKLEENTAIWAIWDNFELTFYGTDADINAVQNAALIQKLAELRQQATVLQGQVDNDVVKAALADALASTADVNATSAPAAVQAAIDTLTAAIGLGEANITAQNVLPAMKALVDATNVYTKEALDEYYTKWNDKYVAGTLTKDEANALQNPEIVTGWHAAITVDNFLLSAWDTNPDFVDAPYYINTWSVEGDNDGSNFHVPFFEYWTGDGDSLGERTLTATLTNVPEGEYSVSAWTRVRAKNGYEAPAYGITLQLNDGTPVDVAAGDQVGATQFFLNTFTAKGNSNGELKIKFNVAADNNISWLSFKNVKYTRLGEVNGINTVNDERQNGNAIFNLNGQKVQQAQKGLYIINGKKVVK